MAVLYRLTKNNNQYNAGYGQWYAQSVMTETMHIEITPEGTTQKTLVCCDFVHELQHLKRLRIAGIKLPFF